MLVYFVRMLSRDGSLLLAVCRKSFWSAEITFSISRPTKKRGNLCKRKFDKSINLIEISMNGREGIGRKHVEGNAGGRREVGVTGACFIFDESPEGTFARRTHNIVLMLFTWCRKNPLFTLTSSRWWRRWWEWGGNRIEFFSSVAQLESKQRSYPRAGSTNSNYPWSSGCLAGRAFSLCALGNNNSREICLDSVFLSSFHGRASCLACLSKAPLILFVVRALLKPRNKCKFYDWMEWKICFASLP